MSVHTDYPAASGGIEDDVVPGALAAIVTVAPSYDDDWRRTWRVWSSSAAEMDPYGRVVYDLGPGEGFFVLARCMTNDGDNVRLLILTAKGIIGWLGAYPSATGSTGGGRVVTA